jgi:hypothetical protein
MKIPVLVEPIAGERYRATGSELFLGTVEGETPEAALVKMKERIEERLSQGARITMLDVQETANPWLDGVGMFRDDPLFDDWQQAITQYRAEANQRVDVP